MKENCNVINQCLSILAEFKVYDALKKCLFQNRIYSKL